MCKNEQKRDIKVKNKYYGVNRDSVFDLGGYIVARENTVDIEILKQDKLQGLVSEYTDIIECSEGIKLEFFTIFDF